MSLLLAEGGLLEGLGVNPWVVAIQAVIFITTFVILSQLLFKRVLTFMQTRETEQAEAAERVKKDREELARVTREYEERIAKVEKDAYAKLQAVLKEAVEAKNKIVEEAAAKARAAADAAKADIAAEKARAMTQLKAEVATYAREAAQKILEEPVDDATVKRVLS